MSSPTTWAWSPSRRPRRGDVRRPHRRGRPEARACSRTPQHPYTWGLLGSIPRSTGREPRRLTDDPGPAAVAARAAAGLRLRAALPARASRRAREPPGARAARRARPPRPLLPARAEKRARRDATIHPELRVVSGEPLLEARARRRSTSRSGGGVLRREVGAACRRSTASRSRSGAGETLGLVGESGCGKSTLGRCLVRLHELTGGPDRLRRARHLALVAPRAAAAAARDADGLPGPVRLAQPAQARRRDHRRAARASTASRAATRKRRVQRAARRRRPAPEHYNRYPHEFSGGQRQRIGIARALALDPS